MSETSSSVKEPISSPEKLSGSDSPASGSTPAAPIRMKYEMCKNWRTKGACPYGDKCLFAHGEKELSRRTTAPAPVVVVKEAEVVVVEPPKEEDCAGQILTRSSEGSKSDEKIVEINLQVDFKLLPEKVASDEERIIRMDEDQSTPPLKKRGSSESKTSSSPVTFREAGSFAKINLISSNAQ